MNLPSVLLDIDLDAFNQREDPVKALEDVLYGVKPGTPATFVVEHHHILSRIHRWVKRGVLPTPFDWIHVDAHHDFYSRNPYVTKLGLNCGTFGYWMPTQYYESFRWMSDGEGENYEFWEDVAIPWLRDNQKVVDHQQCIENWWHDRIIAAVCLVLSPDFVMIKNICPLRDFIVNKLGTGMLDLTDIATGTIGMKDHEIYHPSNWHNERRKVQILCQTTERSQI